jgi:hypothetical protein
MSAAIELGDVVLNDPNLYAHHHFHAYFKRFRAENPVYWSTGNLRRGFWSLFKYDDVLLGLGQRDVHRIGRCYCDFTCISFVYGERSRNGLFWMVSRRGSIGGPLRIVIRRVSPVFFPIWKSTPAATSRKPDGLRSPNGQDGAVRTDSLVERRGFEPPVLFGFSPFGKAQRWAGGTTAYCLRSRRMVCRYLLPARR